MSRTKHVRAPKVKFTMCLSEGERTMLEELAAKELGMSLAMYLRWQIRQQHKKQFGTQPKLVK